MSATLGFCSGSGGELVPWESSEASANLPLPHAPPPRNGDVHNLLPGSVPSSLLYFPCNSHINFPCPSEAAQLCHLGSVLTLNSLIKCLSNLTPQSQKAFILLGMCQLLLPTGMLS